MMRENDVLIEIRTIRDELAARHGGDAHSLSRALIERTRAAGRAVVRFPAREPSPSKASSIPSTLGFSLPPRPESVPESTARADGGA